MTSDSINPFHAGASLDEKVLFRTNAFLYDFQRFYLLADEALGYDGHPEVESILDVIVAKYGEHYISRDELRQIALGEMQSKAAQRLLNNSSVRFPVDVSLEDAMDFFDEATIQELQTVGAPLVTSLTENLGSAATHASGAIVHELMARLQPLAETIREGPLSSACGNLERHLTRLAFLTDPTWNSTRKSTNIRTLLNRTRERLAPDFDPKGGRTERAHEIITERNSILHREGRVDAEFQKQRRSNPVPEEELGALLEVTDQDLRRKLDYLLGYGLRAAFFSWRQIEEHPRLEEVLAFIVIHLLTQEHWMALTQVTDEAMRSWQSDPIEVATDCVNHLLAVKHVTADDPSFLIEQVAQWQAPDGAVWELARLALLDQIDEAVNLVLREPSLREEFQPVSRVFAVVMADPRLR